MNDKKVRFTFTDPKTTLLTDENVFPAELWQKIREVSDPRCSGIQIEIFYPYKDPAFLYLVPEGPVYWEILFSLSVRVFSRDRYKKWVKGE